MNSWHALHEIANSKSTNEEFIHWIQHRLIKQTHNCTYQTITKMSSTAYISIQHLFRILLVLIAFFQSKDIKHHDDLSQYNTNSIQSHDEIHILPNKAHLYHTIYIHAQIQSEISPILHKQPTTIDIPNQLILSNDESLLYVSTLRSSNTFTGGVDVYKINRQATNSGAEQAPQQQQPTSLTRITRLYGATSSCTISCKSPGSFFQGTTASCIDYVGQLAIRPTAFNGNTTTTNNATWLLFADNFCGIQLMHIPAIDSSSIVLASDFSTIQTQVLVQYSNQYRSIAFTVDVSCCLFVCLLLFVLIGAVDLHLHKIEIDLGSQSNRIESCN